MFHTFEYPFRHPHIFLKAKMISDKIGRHFPVQFMHPLKLLDIGFLVSALKKHTTILSLSCRAKWDWRIVLYLYLLFKRVLHGFEPLSS